MPNIRSAKKRVRVTASKNAANKATRSALRTSVKKARVAVENNDENRIAVVREAIKRLDQAVAKGVLHKNNAARKKSALAKSLVS